MAIKDEINKIQTEKNYLRAAIQEKGVFVNDEPFALYPVRISEITDTPGECDDELRTLIEKKMTSYTVPSYVDTIGSFVFYNCVNLESITIPDSVTYIGHSSFRGCTSLTSIDIPSSVTTIGNQAFRNCTSLTNVNISSGVTEIQMYAFYGCSSLASITVNAETPPTLGTRAFDNTNDCPIYVPEDSVETYRTAWPQYADRIQAIQAPTALKWTSSDGTQEISIACEDLAEAGTLAKNDRRTADAGNLIETVEGSAEIGDCVTYIGYSAFQSCSSLTSITIPDSVTKIENFAFSFCSALTSITIPDSVTKIENFAFSYCSSLASVTIGNGVTYIGESAFNHCKALASITIPDSVTTIGRSAFDSCEALTSITVNAETPPTLGTRAFDNTNDCPILVPEDSVETYRTAWPVYADRIQAIQVPTALKWTSSDGTQKISIACEDLAEAGTLAKNDRRTADTGNLIETVEGSAEIGDCVTVIGRYAFDSCFSLTSITIPDSVTTIGHSAFRDCTSLQSITCLSTTPPMINGDVFESSGTNDCPIYVPASSLESYKTARNWSRYKSRIQAIQP